jgi:hypothetical protein
MCLAQQQRAVERESSSIDFKPTMRRVRVPLDLAVDE